MSDPDARDPDAKDRDAPDYKWLVARERGEDIDHVPAAERAPYEQLGALIGSGLAPRAGFRQRVLDAIDAEERRERAAAEPRAMAPDVAQEQPSVAAPAPVPVMAAVATPEPAVTAEAATATPAAAPAEVVPIRSKQPTGPTPRRPAEPATATEPAVAETKVVPVRKRPPWRWIATGGLAAAAVVAAVLFATSARRGAEANSQIAVKSERRAGPTVLRSEPGSHEASIDDWIVVRARVPGSGEIRVYGGSDEKLLESCKHPGGCTIEVDGEHRWLVLEVKLTSPGDVRTVIFSGEGIPASTGSYVTDIEAADSAGVKHKDDETIWSVR